MYTHLGPGCLAVISQLAFIQGWLLREVPLYIIATSLVYLDRTQCDKLPEETAWKQEIRREHMTVPRNTSTDTDTLHASVLSHVHFRDMVFNLFR